MRTPLFIIGSPRSGTSILVDLALAAGYSGYREGMLLSLLTAISSATDRHFDIFASSQNKEVLVSAIDRDEFKHKLFEVFKSVVEEYNSSTPWFDKTGNPEMIEAVPIIRMLWPDAIFIFAKRRGIENVVSRMKKFPVHNFEYHCRDWARNMAAWRTIRASVPAAQWCEVDQQDMIQSPEAVVETVMSFTGCNPEHRERMQLTLRENRPQQTEAGSASQLHDIASLDWSDSYVSTFKRLCGDEMLAYGYTYDRTYRVA